MSKIFLTAIKIYQTFLSFDSGVLAILAPGGACRYSPSCSEFMKQQIEEKGPAKGVLSGIKRIWSCR